MWLLRGMRNIVKQFYWHHIYDRRASVQCVPVFRQHSAQIQLVPLKMMIMIRIRVGQIHIHNGQQNHSGYCPLTFRRVQYTHLQEAQEERMTVKHHTSMRLHLVFSCCISQRLSHCLWWILTDIITGTWTDLKMGLLPNLTPKCFVFLAITTQM